jgi:hypothetical protein
MARGNPFIGRLSIGHNASDIPPLPGMIDGEVAGGIAMHGRFEGKPPFSPDYRACADIHTSVQVMSPPLVVISTSAIASTSKTTSSIPSSTTSADSVMMDQTANTQ